MAAAGLHAPGSDPSPTRMMSLTPRTDRQALEPCAQAYDDLLAACGSTLADVRQPEPCFATIASRVTMFARCARRERLRPEVVLAALREALVPLGQSLPCDARALILRAIDDYYSTPALSVADLPGHEAQPRA